jgi:hypothetical protein
MSFAKRRLLLPAGLVAAAVAAGLAAIASSAGTRVVVNAQAADSGAQPYSIEYYYKTKWGHAEEFLALFKKNHLPVLKKEMELGRILRVSMTAPRYHATEEGRWDYRVTIVFKSAAIANDNFDSAALTKQLYLDQDTFKKEEQRRFEILEAHSDVPVKDVNLEER